MLEKLLTVFRIPELRYKIFLTLGLLAVYRLGYFIPLPIIDQENLKAALQAQAQDTNGMGRALQVLQLFSAASVGMSTIFGLGIMPYISASIIFQLFATVYPPLEKLQKEGEAGRKKINEYTRYATVVLAFAQSFMWVRYLAYSMGGNPILDDFNSLPFHLAAALTMTSGTVLLMWIGEQIDEYGIGNGISLLIMAGILCRMPEAIKTLLSPAFKEGFKLGSGAGIDKLLMLSILFVVVIIGVVLITQGQRKIPTQSAKHVRGRRTWGGQKQYLPLRVNQSGVMPIIFASSLLLIPVFLLSGIANMAGWTSLATLASAFNTEKGVLYNVCYVALIYFFCYFWTAITFNPKDIANNLKDYGSFIPGYRPGRRTAEYLEKVMVRITYVGAAFLSLVAVIPTMIASFLQVDMLVASFFGGTGLLIAVSVALDVVQKIDSHIVMRNYSGLLENDN
jgi:preprotein translocase subunit SecY